MNHQVYIHDIHIIYIWKIWGHTILLARSQSEVSPQMVNSRLAAFRWFSTTGTSLKKGWCNKRGFRKNGATPNRSWKLYSRSSRLAAHWIGLGETSKRNQWVFSFEIWWKFLSKISHQSVETKRTNPFKNGFIQRGLSNEKDDLAMKIESKLGFNPRTMGVSSKESGVEWTKQQKRQGNQLKSGLNDLKKQLNDYSNQEPERTPGASI